MIRALKGCRFGGKDYRKGEVIPETAVDKNFVGSLARMKIIEVTNDDVQLQPVKVGRTRARPHAIRVG